MTTQNNINLDVKGTLAKLIATENITIQNNKVKTASFDVKNRVLTLPIFKEQSGDVYDMLIAHECSHALYTPYKEWEGIDDPELRSYVNVIEDTRIDKLIQKKYPGVVKNYMNGFDILEKKDFFGLFGKNINTDLMIIDKINLRSKSLNRLPFNFSESDKKWISKVDEVKTFNDTVKLAKEILDWQKKQIEEMQKLPNFDELEIAKNYDLSDDEDFEDDDNYSSDNNSDGDDNNQQSENDDASTEEKLTSGNKTTDENGEEKTEQSEADHYGNGSGGDIPKKLLKAVTDQVFENKKDELLDDSIKGFVYGNIPDVRLDSITTYKQFLKEFDQYRIEQSRHTRVSVYDLWLKETFKKFQKNNKKTVMYLVKEFEMKKAATAYKRASTDKTGVIDSLKLPNYKFSDDIFKRLTIVPDGKNHGMMMLLDWSGSMSDTLMNTVEQLLNLVEFVKKVNIPFEVYFFTSELKYSQRDTKKCFNYKDGDWDFENFNLVNCFSHRMTKKEFQRAGELMYHMALYYNANYVYHREFDRDLEMARYNSYGIPHQFSLGNTPLNEALLFCNKLIPMFKSKYGVEKMTFITLTDGGANPFNQRKYSSLEPGSEGHMKATMSDWEKTSVLELDGERLTSKRYGSLTGDLLNHISKKHHVNNIGFYILKRVKRIDLERYIDGKDFSERVRKTDIARKEMTKNKAVIVNKEGYKKYFLLDGKKMNVENFDMNNVEIKKETVSEFKRIFGKAMANRLVSRVVLNKFIQEIA